MIGDRGMADGTEPIDDAEALLRRIPAALRPDPAGPPQLDAFLPHRYNDPDGLSVTRQKYALSEAVGRSAPAGKTCYVGHLTAALIRSVGLDVVPVPQPANLGHALIVRLNSATRGDPNTRLKGKRLLDGCTDLDGPYVGQPA